MAEASRMEAWDGSADLEDRDAALFFTWLEQVRDGMMRSFYGGVRGYFPRSSLGRLLEQGRVGEEVLRDAARQASELASDLSWGEAHRLDLDHPLGGVKVLGAIMGFGRGGIPRVGTPYAVNVASYRGAQPPFRVTDGPSQRHVVDMADPDGAGGFILPGGQSGYPRGPHAWDQLERWQKGSLWRLPLARERVESRTVHRTVLNPPSRN